MDNLYVHCQLAINRFISREKNFVTHKQQCLQAVDCNDIRFQDGKRIHTLGAQSVHAYQVNSQTQTTVWTPPFHETSYCRGLLLLYLLCRNQDSDFIRWCAICDYYFLGELLGVRWASYFSNILRFWVYLFLENNTICHLRVFGSFVKQKINPNSYLSISCPLSSDCWIWIKTVCLLHVIDGS
jgi:hypothetical protein